MCNDASDRWLAELIEGNCPRSYKDVGNTRMSRPLFQETKSQWGDEDERLKIEAHFLSVQDVAEVNSNKGRSECWIESESQAGTNSDVLTEKWVGGGE